MSDTIYVVYKHTSPDGKSYIGVSKQYTVRSKKHARHSHNPHFADAIALYGWDAFTHDIIAGSDSAGEVKRLEQQFIREHNSLYPNGYNISTGGYSPGAPHKSGPIKQTYSKTLVSPDRMKTLMEIIDNEQRVKADKRAAAEEKRYLSQERRRIQAEEKRVKLRERRLLTSIDV